MRSLVTTSLAAAVAAAGLASGWHPAAQASSSLKAAQAVQFATFDSTAVATKNEFHGGNYMVLFHEPSLLERHQARQERSASPERFDIQSAQTQAELQTLKRIQREHVRSIQAAGLNVTPTHYFLASQNGVVIKIRSAQELEAVLALDFVKSVTPETFEAVQTHRSATFVGADRIWDGNAVPGATGTRGQGMVVAVLDTGLDLDHISFFNDASCGLSDSNPKVRSALDCLSTDANGVCNGGTPDDTNGHGTHVASTAVGNVVTRADDPDLNPSEGDQISGIAPCAHLRAYKVCATDTCSSFAIAAGMDNVLMHGDVDVMNFSISGGRAPWGDNDRRKLDLVDAGVFVAAAAGNTSQSTPNPVGQVNHLGPWVMTVASSTHDKQQAGLNAAAGPDSANPPAILQNISMSRGSASPEHAPGTRELKQPASDNPLGCDDHAPGFFAGKAALIHRGSCSFVEKITKAHEAGAELVIIRNNQPSPLSMNTAGAPAVPAYSIEQAVGDALAQFVEDNPDVAEIVLSRSFAPGDVLSDFSLRGPTSGSVANLTKPDITAPGDEVYAAVPENTYGWMGGTSMASPQVAGAAALIRKIHSTWTPTEVKSALMMTAKIEGEKDGVNGDPNTGNWDADDVGHGRLDLTRAARAGLVMNETTARFLAADPASTASNRIDVQSLNLPSMRNANCSPSCTWTRTVRNTLGTASSWSVSPEGFDSSKMTLSVSPTSFSFSGDSSETQELTITAMPVDDQTAAVVFGRITFSEAGNQSPDLHMTTAIKGRVLAVPDIQVQPEAIEVSTPPAATTPVSRSLRISNFGAPALDWEIVSTGSTEAVLPLVHQPANTGFAAASMYAAGSNAGQTLAADFDVPSPMQLKKIDVYGFDFSMNVLNMATSIHWVIYPDDNGKPSGHFAGNPAHEGSIWNFSAAPTANGVSFDSAQPITLGLDLDAANEVVNLQPGKYWLTAYPTLPGLYAPPIQPTWLWHMSRPIMGRPAAIVSTENPEWQMSEADDLAFKIEYGVTLQCQADWLTVTPASGGSIVGGAHADLNLSLNPAGLPDGLYSAAICIRSNHGGTPGHMTYVPVTMRVGVPETNLAVSAIGTPEDIVAGQDVEFLISVANYGPNAASNVEIELALPAGMSFISTVNRDPLRSKPQIAADGTLIEEGDRASRWTCSDNTSRVICAHDGNLLGMAQPLRVRMGTEAGLDSGTLSTEISVSANELDVDPDNNSTIVQTNLARRQIFSSDFESIIDSGPVNLEIGSSAANRDMELNLVTGVFRPYDSAYNGSDLDLYVLSDSLQAYMYADIVPDQGAVATAAGETTIAALAPGDTIDENSPLAQSGSNNMSAWFSGTTAYIGLRFFNEETGEYNYGYVELESTAPGGIPATIKRYVYNVSGGPITIPAP